MIRVAATIASVAVLAVAAPASAHRHIRQHHKPAPATYCQLLARGTVDPGAQTLTVIDHAGVGSEDLCHVELAIQQQALQLRAAWGTPPITFAPGGWKVYLQTGAERYADGSESLFVGGSHYGEASANRGAFWGGQTYAIVTTGGLPYQGWSHALSHEIVDMLVNPTDSPHGDEVADPVENLSYQLDGVNVSDYALPSYFTGGPGPWDAMQILHTPKSP